MVSVTQKRADRIVKLRLNRAEQKTLAKKLIENGMSIVDAAKKLDITESSFRYLLKEK